MVEEQISVQKNEIRNYCYGRCTFALVILQIIGVNPWHILGQAK